MLTLTQQAAMAADPQFQARVRTAMLAEAAAVLAEANDTAHPVEFGLRMALATDVAQHGGGAHLEEFSWGAAASPAVAGAPGTVFTITTNSAAFPARVGVGQPTGFTGGEIVEIAGAGDPVLDGTWAATPVSQASFSIPVLGGVMAGPGGTVTLQPSDANIATAVGAVWNGIAGITPANAGT